MQFRDSQAIYSQIADLICEKIVLQEWKPDEKITSVKELSIQLEVNPTTIMRAFTILEQHDIIYTQRGLGFFLSANALKNSIKYLKTEFMQNHLPGIFRFIYLLDMDIDELKPSFEKFKRQNYSGSH